MKKTIQSWNLNPYGATKLSMPEGAEILTVRQKEGKICVWALVDTDPEPATWSGGRLKGSEYKTFEVREFRFYVTYQAIDIEAKRLKYICTIEVGHFNDIRHFFEILPEG